MADAKTRFVLKRLNWREHWQGGWRRGTGEVALASFDTFEAADAERAKMEAERREGQNPFECGPAVQYWSHLDEPRLRDWLNDRGIDPPAKGIAWPDWWKKRHKKLTHTQRAAVWEACDKVRFFTVREEPVCAVGYAIMGINWEYNDENHDAASDGGRLMTVFRSRARAEQRCAELNAIERQRWGIIGNVPDACDEESDEAMFDMRYRLRRKRGLPSNAPLEKNEGLYNADVPFYEVIEVPLEGLE